MDKKAFMVLMAEMASAFDLGTPTSDKVAVYYKYLSDLPLEMLHSGVSKVIKTYRGVGMPTIAVIREAALGLDEDTQNSEAMEAWRAACKRLPYADHGAKDEVHDAVILAFGSWHEFGNTDPANEGFDMARFIKCYKSLSRRSADKMLKLGATPEPKGLPEAPK